MYVCNQWIMCLPFPSRLVNAIAPPVHCSTVFGGPPWSLRTDNQSMRWGLRFWLGQWVNTYHGRIVFSICVWIYKIHATIRIAEGSDWTTRWWLKFRLWGVHIYLPWLHCVQHKCSDKVIPCRLQTRWVDSLDNSQIGGEFWVKNIGKPSRKLYVASAVCCPNLV